MMKKNMAAIKPSVNEIERIEKGFLSRLLYNIK